METGRNIHDERNSLAGPRPGKKNLRRRQEKFESESKLPRSDRQFKTMEIVPKLVANTTCVWCTFQTETGNSFVICPRCRACQYCGLVGKSSDYCFICGNSAEDDMIAVPPARKRAHLKASHGPVRDNGPVTHSGPRTRSRRPGLKRSG